MIHRRLGGVSFGMLHRLPLLLPCALWAVIAQPAHAAPSDHVCLPSADPAPEWGTPGLGATRKKDRWDGAHQREQTDGTRTARLRSVWSPDSDQVYIEIRVQGDASLDDEDAFVMAVSDAAQSIPELLVEFHPLEDCPHWSDCSGGVPVDPASITYAEGSSSGVSFTWSPVSSTNPSSDFTIYDPWIVTSRAGATFTWTLSFAMAVPTDGAGDFVDRRFYGSAIAYEPTFSSGTYYELPLWCTPSSLFSNDCLIYSGPSPELPEDLPIGAMTDTWPVVDAGVCAA